MIDPQAVLIEILRGRKPFDSWLADQIERQISIGKPPEPSPENAYNSVPPK